MIEKLKEPWLKRSETLLCFGDSLTAASNGYVSMLEEALAPQGIRVISLCPRTRQN